MLSVDSNECMFAMHDLCSAPEHCTCLCHDPVLTMTDEQFFDWLTQEQREDPKPPPSPGNP